MNKKQLSQYILRKAKKLMSIEYKGGRCLKCSNTNFVQLCFHHHNNEKEKNSGNFPIIKEGRWSILKEELDSCDVLCLNCHMELHDGLHSTLDRRYLVQKKVFLEYKNICSCEKCNYDKCNRSLDFHHVVNDSKKFRISSITKRFKTCQELDDMTMKELDKCIILCANCHAMEHFDMDKYLLYKDKIEIKVKTLVEKQPKINRQIVANLLKEGYIQKDIAIKLKASKGTISGIVKELKIN